MGPPRPTDSSRTLLCTPSPQSIRTTSPSRRMATAGSALLLVGTAALVPRNVTVSLTEAYLLSRTVIVLVRSL